MLVEVCLDENAGEEDPPYTVRGHGILIRTAATNKRQAATIVQAAIWCVGVSPNRLSARYCSFAAPQSFVDFHSRWMSNQPVARPMRWPMNARDVTSPMGAITVTTTGARQFRVRAPQTQAASTSGTTMAIDWNRKRPAIAASHAAQTKWCLSAQQGPGGQGHERGLGASARQDDVGRPAPPQDHRDHPEPWSGEIPRDHRYQHCGHQRADHRYACGGDHGITPTAASARIISGNSVKKARFEWRSGCPS